MGTSLMNYRILPPEEWQRLTGIVPPQYLPHPDAATAAIAEDDEGEIVGVLFMQISLHLEPLILKRENVSFKRLHEVMVDVFKERHGLQYYASMTDERVARMAYLCDMKPIEGRMFVGKVV